MREAHEIRTRDEDFGNRKEAKECEKNVTVLKSRSGAKPRRCRALA